MNEPFAHDLPCEKAGQVEVWEYPNKLSASAILPTTANCVNTLSAGRCSQEAAVGPSGTNHDRLLRLSRCKRVVGYTQALVDE